MSINKVILVGRLGKDPEIRYDQTGRAYASLSLATSETYKDKNGQKVQQTEWHMLSFSGRLAEICGEYLKKGSQIFVEGKLKTNKWVGKDGKNNYQVKIYCYKLEMLDSPNLPDMNTSFKNDEVDLPDDFNDNSEEIPF